MALRFLADVLLVPRKGAIQVGFTYSLNFFRASSNVGRLNLSPCAVTNGEHPDRLSTLIDFIYDPVNVRPLAIELPKNQCLLGKHYSA
jgi:hypothetical protein